MGIIKSIIPYCADEEEFEHFISTIETPMKGLGGKSVLMDDDPDLESIRAFINDRAVGNPVGESSIGFASIDHPLNGATDGRQLILMIERRERLLPNDVVDHQLQVKIKNHEEATGLHPTAREIKVMKDEIRAELLPKAMIRSRTFPVVITRQNGKVWLFVMNASSKLCDSIISYLSGSVFQQPLGVFAPIFGMIENQIGKYLKDIVRVSIDSWVEPNDERLADNVKPSVDIKLKHNEKGSATIKSFDDDGIRTAYEEYICDGFTVSSLGVESVLTGEDSIYFKISDKCRFFGFSASSTRIHGEQDDFTNTLAVFASESIVLGNEVISQIDLIKAVCGEAIKR